MRGLRLACGFVIGLLALLGCHHDKYGMIPPAKEEYTLPPDEPRYNLPDTAGYRKPPPREDKKAGSFGAGGPGGRFDPGGF